MLASPHPKVYLKNMREGYPGSEQTVTEDQLLADPKLWAQYREQSIVRIKAGETVLMLRNPEGSSDMEPGVIRDYYAGGEYIGYIDCDDDAGTYIPYRRAEVDEEHAQRMGDEEFEDLSQAERVLRDYAEETILKFK